MNKLAVSVFALAMLSSTALFAQDTSGGTELKNVVNLTSVGSANAAAVGIRASATQNIGSIHEGVKAENLVNLTSVGSANAAAIGIRAKVRQNIGSVGAAP